MQQNTRTLLRRVLSVIITSIAPALTIVSGCTHPAPLTLGSYLPITRVDVDAEGSAIPIASWRVIGAFPVSQLTGGYTERAEAEALDHDYLAGLNGSEVPLKLPRPTSHTNIDFGVDIYDDITITGSQSGTFLNQDQEFPAGIVPTQALFWHTFEGFKVIYTASELLSSREQDVALLASGNSPLRIWLDNHIIVDPRPGSVGHDPNLRAVVMLHLSPGIHVLLVKEFCFPLRNNFVVRILPRAAALGFVNSHTGVVDIVDHVIVAPDMRLLISDNLRFFLTSPADEARIEIRDMKGGILLRAPLQLRYHPDFPIRGFDEGEYSVRVEVGSNSFSENVFIGSPAHQVQQYLHRCADKGIAPIFGYDPCVICEPLQAMVSEAGATRRLDRDQPILLLMSQMERQLHRVSPIPSRAVEPHFQLIGYHSSEDTQSHYYFLYLPSAYRKPHPMPLVVALGSHPDRHPFLRSGPTTTIDALSSYASQADRFGYAVIIPFLRGEHEDSLARAELFGALHDAERHHFIDKARVYLSGDCADGKAAILYAERYPDLFAAVSVGRPATGVMLESTRYWDDVNNPLLYIENIRHTPVRLVHGDYFPHSPTIQTITFRDQSARIGKYVDAIFLPRDGELAVDDMMNLEFSFFQGKTCHHDLTDVEFTTRRLAFDRSGWVEVGEIKSYTKAASVKARFQSQNSLKLDTSNITKIVLYPSKFPKEFRKQKSINLIMNGLQEQIPTTKGPVTLRPEKLAAASWLRKSHDIEGPISDVFLNHCVFVLGTGGDRWEQEESRHLMRGIEDKLHAQYGVEYPRISDRNIDVSALRESNIVLVGKINKGTAPWFVRGRVPLRFVGETLQLGHENIAGKDLIAATVYPNPLNPHKYALVVDFSGSGDMPNPALEDVNFDAVVWTVHDPIHPVETGDWYWDSDWNNVIRSSSSDADN